MKRLCCYLGVVLLFTSLFCTTLASAQSAEELSRARAAFQSGTELEQAGDWGRALQQFRTVGQVKMTPQVRFHIAWCEENLGKLVIAMGGYQLALGEAELVGEDFKEELEEKIVSLEGRIPRIGFVRGSGARSAVIKLDGAELGAASIGVEVAVDPGPHEITANASGYQTFSLAVDMAEGELKEVQIDLKPTPTRPAKTMESSKDWNEGWADEDKKKSQEADSSSVPYVVGGAGVVMLAAGGYFWIQRSRGIKFLEDRCSDPGNCIELTAAVVESKNSDNNLNNLLAQVATGFGVAAVSLAVVLYVVDQDSSSTSESSASRSTLTVRPEGPEGTAFGLSLSGSF